MIVVLASGSGTNFESVAERFGDRILGVVCNVPGAGVLERARCRGIPTRLVPHGNYPSRSLHEASLVDAIVSLGSPCLVVLAGYMRILSPAFFEDFRARLPEALLINIHPAPLEAYKGPDGYGAAVAGRWSHWAISVHEVTPELDAGPLLGTVRFPVLAHETAEDLHARVRPLEHELLNDVIEKILRKEHLPCPPTSA